MLYIWGQGNGAEAIVQESKMVALKGTPFWTGTDVLEMAANMLKNRGTESLLNFMWRGLF
jgi:hypothetical protein